MRTLPQTLDQPWKCAGCPANSVIWQCETTKSWNSIDVLKWSKDRLRGASISKYDFNSKKHLVHPAVFSGNVDACSKISYWEARHSLGTLDASRILSIIEKTWLALINRPFVFTFFLYDSHFSLSHISHVQESHFSYVHLTFHTQNNIASDDNNKVSAAWNQLLLWISSSLVWLIWRFHFLKINFPPWHLFYALFSLCPPPAKKMTCPAPCSKNHFLNHCRIYNYNVITQLSLFCCGEESMHAHTGCSTLLLSIQAHSLHLTYIFLNKQINSLEFSL